MGSVLASRNSPILGLKVRNFVLYFCSPEPPFTHPRQPWLVSVLLLTQQYSNSVWNLRRTDTGVEEGWGGAGRSAKKKEVTNGGWTSLGVDTSAFFFVT